MRRILLLPLLLIAALFLVGIFSANAVAAEGHAKKSTLGQRIDEFSLQDFRGKAHKLSDFKNHKLLVVAFLGTECPLVKLYSSRLVEIEKKYRDQGVGFVGINANQQDSLTEIAHHARKHEIEFPMLKDPRNEVADLFGAQRTPEVFVLDADRRVRYWGRIDDQYYYEIQRTKTNKHYLTDALDQLLKGEQVGTPQTESVGCHIGRKLKPDESSDVTYSQQISRIFQKRCVACHRSSEIAPFSLTSYDDAAGWAEMIREVVQQRRMPPWHANPEYGKFVNEKRLSDEEVQLIEQWVRAGAPEGDPKQLPAPRQFTPGWRIGEPDQIIKMADKPFAVPAHGEVRYQYFVVDPGWKEDKYIQAAEARAGNRAVVHHIIVANPGRRLARGRQHDIHSDWITAMAPGSSPLVLEPGLAKLVPAGSKLMFQMHYTPNGTATEDLSYVGFKFADPKTVKKIVGTNRAGNRRFVIPAGADNHRVEASYRFGRDSLILAMFPHMHLRGKSFRYTAIYPDGGEEILLDVPNYDFNWQNGYQYAKPKLMPAGTRLHCVAHFDNSEENLANPDPTVAVRWGDQTWEEMMIGYFDMAYADQDLTRPDHGDRTDQFAALAKAGDAQLNDALRQMAGAALDSQESLNRFAAALRKLVPQLDRVCITSVHDGKLTVDRVAQEDSLRRLVGSTGISIRAEGLALAEYAVQEQPQVNPHIARLKAGDMRYMGRAFASSLHVPKTYEDRPATVNFWSREEDAFPAEAVKLLSQIAQAMGTSE